MIQQQQSQLSSKKEGSNSKARNNFYNVPQIEADPAPDMPTIEIKNNDNDSKISCNQFYQTYQSASRQSNVNICNIEQQILQYIYEGNSEKLKELKIHLRDLNFLEVKQENFIQTKKEFSEDFIDQQIFPLSLAVAIGNVEIVKLLLQNEVIDVNLQTEPQGLTALKLACSNGYYEIAEILVTHGADVNQQNNQGSVPLFYCFTRLEEETNYFENKFLCFKMAELLIDNGADIDSIVNEKKGYTLLMLFCAGKQQFTDRELQVNMDVIKFLLQNGADRERKSNKGKTALDLCKKHPAKQKIEKMLKELKPFTGTRKFQYKPQLINQKQIVKIEGRQQSGQCCCSLLASSSRNIGPIESKPKKKWWDIF